MNKKNVFTTFGAIIILAMTLSACNLFRFPGAVPTLDPYQISTIAAATVSAKFTQMAAENWSAQLTQQAIATSTPYPTSTPFSTNTPINTFTPVAPTFTPIPPTNTPVPIPCNAASFMGDVSIKDGSEMIAGDAFVKTWQVKNVGTCSWTKEYKIFFYGGNQLKAPSSVTFPKDVKPGETLNLSVPMTAPSELGKYSGSWMLKSTNGTVFGVGTYYNVAMTVNIKVVDVPGSKDPNTVYDFVKNYCEASWKTNAGNIDCPSAGIDYKHGSITRTYSPVLEGGFVDDEGALITVPASGSDGMIRGKFPKRLVKVGDHFAALLTCSDKKPDCSVTFELLYSVAGDTKIFSLGSWTKVYTDPKIKAYIDLSGLAGEEINFYLKVSNDGGSNDDMAQWVAARITRP